MFFLIIRFSRLAACLLVAAVVLSSFIPARTATAATQQGDSINQYFYDTPKTVSSESLQDSVQSVRPVFHQTTTPSTIRLATRNTKSAKSKRETTLTIRHSVAGEVVNFDESSSVRLATHSVNPPKQSSSKAALPKSPFTLNSQVLSLNDRVLINNRRAAQHNFSNRVYRTSAYSRSNIKPLSVAQLLAKPIQSVGVDIRLSGTQFPKGTANTFVNAPLAAGSRGWSVSPYHWAASASHHGPLYFEDVNLERHGYGCQACLQPAVSAAHFFGTLPTIPYQMATNCPSDCIYTLGYYRPGNCVPWQRNYLPLRWDASLVEAGAIAGAILIFP